jgi:DNA polymerase IV
MDAFFASIEQRDDPSLLGKPVIVGASSARGVVSAASYEARRFGVYSAMPGFRARQLCPEGIFLAGNMAHYAAVSAEIAEVFQGFTPLVEPLALDEAFLDITGSAHLFGGAHATARVLKQAVKERVGLVVSVGVGPNKLVAKLACSLSKPDGLRLVSSDEVATLLAPLPVRKLWGVGPVLAAELQAAGFHTLAELARADLVALGGVVGQRAEELRDRARGVDNRPVEADRAPKSIGEENTFERDVSDRRLVMDVLGAHAEAVARRLRASGYRARTVSIKARLGRRRNLESMSEDDLERGRGAALLYPVRSRSHTLSHATNDGAEISQWASRLWDRAGIEEPVRLLGVSVSSLEPVAAEQLELFVQVPIEQRLPRSLGPALDAINERFGAGSVRRGMASPGKINPTGKAKRGE